MPWIEATGTNQPPGYSFTIDVPATIYLAVDARGNPKLGDEWKLTSMTLTWGENHRDVVYQRSFAPGLVEVPGNATEHTKGSFGMPHTAFVESDAGGIEIKSIGTASVHSPTEVTETDFVTTEESPEFRLEIDRLGNAEWSLLETIAMQGSYVAYELPANLEAEWI